MPLLPDSDFEVRFFPSALLASSLFLLHHSSRQLGVIISGENALPLLLSCSYYCEPRPGKLTDKILLRHRQPNARHLRISILTLTSVNHLTRNSKIARDKELRTPRISIQAMAPSVDHIALILRS